MKRLLILAAVSAAALSASACITIIDADGQESVAWSGENAQPFDSARSECRAQTRQGQRSDAFRNCMAAKGWTRN